MTRQSVPKPKATPPAKATSTPKAKPKPKPTPPAKATSRSTSTPTPKRSPTAQAEPTKLKAAVLGGSIAGLMASVVLYHKKFEVVLYEKYPEYTRDIQWTVRQSFIDYFYSVDKDIAKYLFASKKLVSPVTNGYRFLSDKTLRFPDGAYLYKRRDGLLVEGSVKSPSDKRAKPDESCAASLDEDFVGIIRASELEAYLLEQIRTKTKVEVRRKEAPKCVRRGAGYALLEGARNVPYDLIVVCVGAGNSREEFLAEGKSREEFPAKFIPMSRQRVQVAGDVQLKRHGMVIQYQHAKIDDNDKGYLPYLPSGELLYSTLLSTDQNKTTCWVIGDVSTEFLSIYAKTKKSDADKRDKLAQEECGKIAARTMLATEKEVLEAGVEGVVGETVKAFVSQAKLSTAACAGDNLILAGDAVGAGHWAVGGGMHVAAVCHQKRLETLAKDFAKADRRAALEKYSKDVLEDTMAWISKSMEYYYLSIPKGVVEKVFKAVREALENNDSINVPKEMQKRIISAYFGPRYEADLKKVFTDEL